MKFESTVYTLFYKPNGKFPCKRKYWHEAKTDQEAIQLSVAYAEKKNATIHRLNKEFTITEDTDLIKND